MADPMTGPAPRCQWCSALLPAADLGTCPSCGATLQSAANEEIRGVTTLDPEAILRARAEVARPRSRLLSFITGEQPVEPVGEADAAAIAEPDEAVRREMLRLQLEAERADLEAEVVAMKTDTVLEQGIDLSALGTDVPADAPAAPAAAPAPAEPADPPAARDTPPPAPGA